MKYDPSLEVWRPKEQGFGRKRVTGMAALLSIDTVCDSRRVDNERLQVCAL